MIRTALLAVALLVAMMSGASAASIDPDAVDIDVRVRAPLSCGLVQDGVDCTLRSSRSTTDYGTSCSVVNGRVTCNDSDSN